VNRESQIVTDKTAFDGSRFTLTSPPGKVITASLRKSPPLFIDSSAGAGYHANLSFITFGF
jgi:hypothetical protein